MRRARAHFRINRRGVALLTVMMSLVLIAALAAANRTSMSAGLRAVERDIVDTKARWQVEGCAAVGLAALNSAQAASGGKAWNTLDSILIQTPLPDVVRGCDLSVLATGRVRGISQYDQRSFARLLTLGGIAVTRADSLAAALMDWIDSDDAPRDRGAETTWYREVQRPSPRNGAIRDVDELKLVRGFDAPAFLSDTLRNLVGIDAARVPVRYATLPVLLSIEGVSDADAAEMIRLRVVPSGLQLRTSVPGGIRDVAQVITNEPDGWELVARLLEGSNHSLATRRLTLGRTQSRIAVLRVQESQ